MILAREGTKVVVLERFPVAAMTRSTDPSAASPASWPMYQQFGRQRGEADSAVALALADHV